MITHYAEISIPTVSTQGVLKVYHEILGFPVRKSTEDELVLDLCPFTQLRFVRKQDSINPAHLAFEVGYSQYPVSRDFLASKLPELAEVEESRGIRYYFRDGDGNLLELYAHTYVQEGVLEPLSHFGVMYLREAGFVLTDFPAFHEFATETLGMRSAYPPGRSVCGF